MTQHQLSTCIGKGRIFISDAFCILDICAFFFDNIADGPEFDPSLPSMKRAKLLLKCYKKLPYALAHKS